MHKKNKCVIQFVSIFSPFDMFVYEQNETKVMKLFTEKFFAYNTKSILH